ncbi:hypothetical protein TNCV_10611 [Trichonephila clavipes]|nr:hypothetical protein TNCV_10611 [Trichonephila clavipes]
MKASSSSFIPTPLARADNQREEHPRHHLTNCMHENVNLCFRYLIPIPHSSYSASFRDIEVCEALQRDAYPDH